jgi:hypothetical protein
VQRLGQQYVETPTKKVRVEIEKERDKRGIDNKKPVAQQQPAQQLGIHLERRRLLG